jgi:hypothetical protein
VVRFRTALLEFQFWFYLLSFAREKRLLSKREVGAGFMGF